MDETLGCVCVYEACRYEVGKTEPEEFSLFKEKLYKRGVLCHFCCIVCCLCFYANVHALHRRDLVVCSWFQEGNYSSGSMVCVFFSPFQFHFVLLSIGR